MRFEHACMCLHNEVLPGSDNDLSSTSHIRMPIVYQRCVDKSFTLQNMQLYF